MVSTLAKLIINSKVISAFASNRASKVEGICSMLYQILDHLKQHGLLHFYHIGVILSAKVHQDRAALRQLVRISSVAQQYLSHSERNRLIFEVVFILVHPREAVDQGTLLHAVQLVHIRAILSKQTHDLEVASHSSCGYRRITVFFSFQIKIDVREIFEHKLDYALPSEIGCLTKW